MIGVIAGLRAETALISGAVTACSGGDADQAERLALALLEQGAEGLLSFGIAGGLVPHLASGSVVVPEGVVVSGKVMRADGRWVQALRAALPDADRGLVAGSDVVVATPAAKELLRARSGAVAVDMESAAVAKACQTMGRPFAILRAIADPAERGVPWPALAGLDCRGRTRPLNVIWRLARRPASLPAVIQVGRDTKAALAALGLAAGILGASLGFQALQVVGKE